MSRTKHQQHRRYAREGWHQRYVGDMHTRPEPVREADKLRHEIEEDLDTYEERKHTWCTMPECDCQAPCAWVAIGDD